MQTPGTQVTEQDTTTGTTTEDAAASQDRRAKEKQQERTKLTRLLEYLAILDRDPAQHAKAQQLMAAAFTQRSVGLLGSGVRVLALLVLVNAAAFVCTQKGQRRRVAVTFAAFAAAHAKLAAVPPYIPMPPFLSRTSAARPSVGLISRGAYLPCKLHDLKRIFCLALFEQSAVNGIVDAHSDHAEHARCDAGSRHCRRAAADNIHGKAHSDAEYERRNDTECICKNICRQLCPAVKLAQRDHL